MSQQAVPQFSDLAVSPDARFAVVASRWNSDIVDPLVAGAIDAFVAHGVAADAVEVLRVPGAWELPVLAKHLAASGVYAVIVALGCVIRGETRHYEQVADECAAGLMRVALDTGVPIMNGVLAVEHAADARARAGGVRGNKGADVAVSALALLATMQEHFV